MNLSSLSSSWLKGSWLNSLWLLIKFIYSEKATNFLRNLQLTFDYITYSQKLDEDFTKFCGLLRIYELYFRTPLLFVLFAFEPFGKRLAKPRTISYPIPGLRFAPVTIARDMTVLFFFFKGKSVKIYDQNNSNIKDDRFIYLELVQW